MTENSDVVTERRKRERKLRELLPARGRALLLFVMLNEKEGDDHSAASVYYSCYASSRMAPYPQAPQFNPWQTPAQSGKAIASLVLGILSMTGCGGPFTGIPAIVFGFLARKDISKSDGQLDGGGLAVAGIVTGMIGTFGFVVYMVVYGATMIMATSSPVLSPPPYTPPPTTPTSYYGPSTGKVHVLQLKSSDGALKAQLAKQAIDASSRGERVIVMTVSPTCTACTEIQGTFGDYMMQITLDRVTIVKVDVNDFSKDLAAQGLDKGKNLPWFFLLDAGGNATSDMSADEWDDNRPENIAPVMSEFLDGTLIKRSPSGGKPGYPF